MKSVVSTFLTDARIVAVWSRAIVEVDLRVDGGVQLRKRGLVSRRRW